MYKKMKAERIILVNKQKDKIKIKDEHLQHQFTSLVIFTIVIALFCTFAGATAYFSIYAPIIFLVLGVYLIYKFKKIIVRSIIIGGGYQEVKTKKKVIK